MNIKIGAKIKQLRKQGDITQEKLAEALGVTGQAVSRWESEAGYPDMEYIPLLAKYFNVTTDFLFDYAAEGKEAGIEKKLLEVAEKLREKGMKAEDIAEATGLRLDKLLCRPDDMISLLRVDPIRLCFGCGLVPLADSSQGGNLMERVVAIRRGIACEMGAVIPMVRLQDNIKLSHNRYSVYIKGIEVFTGTIETGGASDGQLAGEEIVGETLEPSAIIAARLSEIILKHLHELLTREDVHALVENIKKSSPVLIGELIPKYMNIGDIQKVLAKLLKEGISIRDLASILETLADYAPVTRDTDMLTEYVRAGLRRAITQTFLSKEENTVITLDPTLEQTLTAKIQKTEIGSFVNIEPELSGRIFESLKTETEKLTAVGTRPIILTSPFVRVYFKQLVEEVAPDLAVLSYSEIDPGANILSVGMVSA